MPKAEKVGQKLWECAKTFKNLPLEILPNKSAHFGIFTIPKWGDLKTCPWKFCQTNLLILLYQNEQIWKLALGYFDKQICSFWHFNYTKISEFENLPLEILPNKSAHFGIFSIPKWANLKTCPCIFWQTNLLILAFLLYRNERIWKFALGYFDKQICSFWHFYYTEMSGFENLPLKILPNKSAHFGIFTIPKWANLKLALGYFDKQICPGRQSDRVFWICLIKGCPIPTFILRNKIQQVEIF